jgi:hypothetical protein
MAASEAESVRVVAVLRVGSGARLNMGVMIGGRCRTPADGLVLGSGS